MSKLNFVLLRIVRWSGWPLLPLVGLFLVTGYAMSGRYGFARLLDGQSALTLHKLLHAPLLVLLIVHTAPAAWLALQRWGWVKPRDQTHPSTAPTSNPN